MKQMIKPMTSNKRYSKTPHWNSKKKKEFKKNDDSSRDLCGNIKHINIYIIEVPVGEEEKQVLKTYLKKQ